jgi:hypothetical protein
MRGFHNSAFNPQTLVVLETAFDEAWLTLKSIGNTSIKADELARSVLRLAMDGERDPVRLHDGALKGSHSHDGLERRTLSSKSRLSSSGVSRVGSQYCNPGDQRGRHSAKEYCNDEWKCFPQLCAHQ